MNSDAIVLFIVTALLVILAVFLYFLFRKSIEKKLLEEQKKIGAPELINITPEFKFESLDLNNLDIPSINEVKKSIMDSQSTEIVIDEPKIIDTRKYKETIQEIIAVKEASDLRLEDTITGTEDGTTGKKIRKKKGKKVKKQRKKSSTIPLSMGAKAL